MIDALCGVIRRERALWRSFDAEPADFLAACADHELSSLIYECLRDGDGSDDWPPAIRATLGSIARGAAARELLHRREIVAVLDALEREGIVPVLLKGSALAYTVYDAAASRPRIDTDLFIRRDQLESVQRILTTRGYTTPTSCGGQLFGQLELAKTDELGVTHAFDFHWKISTQAVFADVLTYDELAAASVPVPRLGPRARAAGRIHALMLACIHPVMHHRRKERLIWTYDIHLLAMSLSRDEFDEFASLALTSRVAAVCCYALELSRTRFGTEVPDGVLAALRNPTRSEPSAEYLASNRRWHHELFASLRFLESWSDRVRLLREVLFPEKRYIVAIYGLAHGTRHGALLAPLYAHRLLAGIWKIATGRK